MSLNDIELSPFLLTSLYPNSLYELHETKENQAVEFLGENQKKVLILVKYADAKYIADQSMPFFLKLLSACKLSMQDIALVNIATQSSTSYLHFTETLQSIQCISFGISPSEMQLPINFPQYQVQQFSNCNYLHADTLNQLENDAAIKKKLWLALQKMFLS